MRSVKSPKALLIEHFTNFAIELPGEFDRKLIAFLLILQITDIICNQTPIRQIQVFEMDVPTSSRKLHANFLSSLAELLDHSSGVD